MSFFSFWQTTEKDVVAVITKLKQDVAIAESDVNSALKWLAGEVPAIVSGLQTALTLAQAVGVVTAPEITAANLAVVALNAFAAAQQSGSGNITSNAHAVVQGYVAYTQAAAAVSVAKATAASAVKVTAKKS